MSRSSKSNLIVRNDGVELLLGLSKTGNVVKDDFGFFVLLCAFGDSGLDCINDGCALATTVMASCRVMGESGAIDELERPL